jgi:hypothetical protein
VRQSNDLDHSSTANHVALVIDDTSPWRVPLGHPHGVAHTEPADPREGFELFSDAAAVVTQHLHRCGEHPL